MNSLNSPNSRRLLCEFVIAASVCAAAYYFLVLSGREQLRAVRQDVAQAQAKDAVRLGAGNLTEAQLQDLRRATAERIADIKARSGPATDEATMFVRMSELAAAHALRIEQLNPSRAPGQQNTAAPPPPPPPPTGGAQPGTPDAQAAANLPAPKDSSITYSIVVTGAYSDIASFLGSLPAKLGYTAIRNVRVSQPNLVRADQLRAEITTEHFAFDVSGIKAPPLAATQPLIQPMPVPAAAAAD